MAGELSASAAQLERTHRLEAWAEMARQVAHDIKNPLTPIQLSAEHLRRVHHDRGEPLVAGPRRVRRHDPHPGAAAAADRVGVLELRARRRRRGRRRRGRRAARRSRRALPRRRSRDRIAIDVECRRRCRRCWSIACCSSRALINIIENALHAMPGGGTLTVDGARWTARRRACCRSPTPASAWTPRRWRASSSPTSRPRRRGTGLGPDDRAAQRRAERRHDRRRESKRGVGTTVTIALPLPTPCLSAGSATTAGAAGVDSSVKRVGPRPVAAIGAGLAATSAGAGASGRGAPASPRPPDQTGRQVAVGDHDQRDLRVGGDQRDDQRP